GEHPAVRHLVVAGGVPVGNRVDPPDRPHRAVVGPGEVADQGAERHARKRRPDHRGAPLVARAAATRSATHGRAGGRAVPSGAYGYGATATGTRTAGQRRTRARGTGPPLTYPSRGRSSRPTRATPARTGSR